jgi:HK97 family phage prohead protease
MDRFLCNLVELKFQPPADAADTSVSAMTFTGYGAVFGNVDAGGDVIEPGAFAAFLADVKSGKQPWPAMLSQHGGMQLTSEDMTPIGVWTDFAEDGYGLKVTGELAATPRGMEMHTLMKMQPRPAIDGLSIGYIAKEVEPRTSPDQPRRRIKRIDLVEISPVTRPMNGKARVSSVKSIEELTALDDVERYLRDAGGFSRTEAKALISRVKSCGPRDADQDAFASIKQALMQRGQSIP